MHSGELMVVLIVLIVMVGRILQTGAAGRRKHRDDAVADEASEGLRAEVRQLRERVQVLEAIVTDGDRNRGLALEREIERLRDDRPRQEA